MSVGEWLDAEEVVLEKSEAGNGSDPRADGPVGYANRFAFDSAPVGSAECRFLVEQVDDGNFPQVEVAFDVLAEADAAIVRFDDDPLEFHQQVASAALDEIAGSQILVRLGHGRSEEHTSELQSLMRISYAVFCLKNKNKKQRKNRSIE